MYPLTLLTPSSGTARTPGKHTLREILESEAWQRSTSTLALALGKTMHGEPYVSDLAALPHLLIAGSRGAGKSVGLNALLLSLVHRAAPDDVRLILIDPMPCRLTSYEGIPHLLTSIIGDPRDAANALCWAVRQMEARFRMLATEGVRNIDQYNRKVRHMSAADGVSTDQSSPRPLPFIVVVVSELAELMMAAPFVVEDSIVRLAHMSRAAGIHLILATGWFSVGVVTGLIKANLPARIAYRVQTRAQSRCIVDQGGAERLRGSGEMLFLPPSARECLRLRGPCITEEDAARVSSYLRGQGPAQLDESITADDWARGWMSREPESDPMYEPAARLVVATGEMSISYLQRCLGIGFSRAARLLDRIRTEGLG